jgi:hypothetical protein
VSQPEELPWVTEQEIVDTEWYRDGVEFMDRTVRARVTSRGSMSWLLPVHMLPPGVDTLMGVPVRRGPVSKPMVVYLAGEGLDG